MRSYTRYNDNNNNINRVTVSNYARPKHTSHATTRNTVYEYATITTRVSCTTPPRGTTGVFFFFFSSTSIILSSRLYYCVLSASRIARTQYIAASALAQMYVVRRRPVSRTWVSSVRVLIGSKTYESNCGFHTGQWTDFFRTVAVIQPCHRLKSTAPSYQWPT